MMKKKDTGEDGHADSDPKFAPHRRGQKGVVAGKNPAPDSIEDRRIRDEIHRKKREHTLKNYQIMIEYKHLKQHVPPGIYILPSFTSMRTWCGVIFLRAGAWKSAIFRFTIDMPDNYPGNNACPKITFLNEVFHPMIDLQTGEMDLSLRFPTWVGGKHYILFCLKYVKQLFYLRPGIKIGDESYMKLNEDGKCIYQCINEGKVKNEEATRLWLTDKKRFMEMCHECSQMSLLPEILYAKRQDSSLQFSIWDNNHHENVRDRVLQTGSSHGFQHGTSPQKR